MTDPVRAAEDLARASVAEGHPTAWFERLYRAAEAGGAVVPWDRGAPNPHLVATLPRAGAGGGRALVVGCGLGHDAEYVAAQGFAVTAFDVSETAVRACRAAHPESRVDYRVADLLDPPAEFARAFDLVVESLTVQSMPRSVRAAAVRAVAGFVAPGGRLLVIAGALDDDADPAAGPPWLLVPADVDAFAAAGLTPVQIERVPDGHAGRWRAVFSRAAG